MIISHAINTLKKYVYSVHSTLLCHTYMHTYTHGLEVGMTAPEHWPCAEWHTKMHDSPKANWDGEGAQWQAGHLPPREFWDGRANSSASSLGKALLLEGCNGHVPALPGLDACVPTPQGMQGWCRPPHSVQTNQSPGSSGQQHHGSRQPSAIPLLPVSELRAEMGDTPRQSLMTTAHTTHQPLHRALHTLTSVTVCTQVPKDQDTN